MRKRTSLIWQISKTTLEQLVAKSDSLGKVLRHFGLENKGGNPKTLKQRLNEDDISYSHMVMGTCSNVGRRFAARRLPKEEALSKFFIEQSEKDRSVIREYILAYSLIEYKCKCGNDGNWCGEKLSLQLDHINGNSQDHRLENLRWLCPNCHSQTKTFAGRKLNKNKTKISKIDPNWRKRPNIKGRKVEWPSKEELQRLIWEIPTTLLAKQFGVSDVAVTKWCKSYGISKPPRGYWAKNKFIGV